MNRNPVHQFLIHNKEDNVGVAIVDIKASSIVKGLIIETQESIELKALTDVPWGHKIALANLEPDDTVIKYGHDIGRTISKIRKGEYIHIHNVKTKKW
jgi:(2R)-sulfolactate sulfo-lyase subunit alpha